MNPRRRAALALLVAAPLALAGCGSGTPPIWLAPSASAPIDVPGTIGYLTTNSTEVIYIQWQGTPSGSIQGTILDDETKGTAPDEQVQPTRGLFEGHVNGNAVTIDVFGNTSQGVVSSDTLTMNVVQSDGSIQSYTFHRASDSDYNAALGALRTSVQQVNDEATSASASAQAEQQQAAAQLSAEQSVTHDYQAVSSDESALKNDLSSLGDTVTGTAHDVGSTHQDEQNVLNESGNGTDNGTVCGDAASVSGDAASVSGDASSLSGDLSSFSGDLSSLNSDAASLNSDLTALLNIEPGYSGGGSGPSPSAAHQAVSGADTAASVDVRSANGDIDQENSYVSTAYGYAADADRVGHCGEAPSLPSPISHVSTSGSQGT